MNLERFSELSWAHARSLLSIDITCSIRFAVMWIVWNMFLDQIAIIDQDNSSSSSKMTCPIERPLHGVLAP